MKQIWDLDELAEHWSLKFEETQLLKTKPARNHLVRVTKLSDGKTLISDHII